MDYQTLQSFEEFDRAIRENEKALIYFSSDSCQVCKVLKPKVAEIIAEKFPKIKLFYVNINKSPIISGQNTIFTIPTLLVFFEGRELIRKSRNIGIAELEEEIGKYGF